MFWGLSSALDLYDEYLKAFRINDVDGEDESKAGGDGPEAPNKINILLLGETDARHVIRTLAKRYTHRVKPEIHIYIVEGSTELVARHMMLLAVALEDSSSFNLVSKAHLFMDLYGNTMIRPSSNYYMAAKGRTFMKMVADDDELQRLAPILNIQFLKYRERDGLQMAFTFWQPLPRHVYNITDYWEQRGRALMGTRYDHRNGIFDWDLNMTLKDRGGQQICSQEYRYWRESGVAFVFPEYEHCKPNKTFCAGLVQNGTDFKHRGYVGDIQTGPFCGFGLRSAEERMHNSAHGENDYRATDITERNLLEFFHELQTQEPYVHDATRSRRYGSVQLLMTPLLSHQQEEDITAMASYDHPWIQVPGVTVHYLSSIVIPQMQSGDMQWNNMFDIIFVAYNYNVFLKKSVFTQTLKPQGLFILETMQMTVNRKDLVKNYESDAKKYFKEAGLKPVVNYNAINSKNQILRYRKPLLDDDGNDADEDKDGEDVEEDQKDEEEESEDDKADKKEDKFCEEIKYKECGCGEENNANYKCCCEEPSENNPEGDQPEDDTKLNPNKNNKEIDNIQQKIATEGQINEVEEPFDEFGDLHETKLEKMKRKQKALEQQMKMDPNNQGKTKLKNIAFEERIKVLVNPVQEKDEPTKELESPVAAEDTNDIKTRVVPCDDPDLEEFLRLENEYCSE